MCKVRQVSLAAAAIGLLATAYYQLMSDLDLGWHLRYGEYFWQTGKLLRENTFSFWLPEYVWANHSWGYDVLLYPVYRWLGLSGLSWLAAVLAGGSWWLVWRRFPLTVRWWGWLASWWLSYFLLGQGLKSQLVSWTLWAGLSQAVWHRRLASFWLPVVALIWVNLHGQFVVGLILLWGFELIRDYQVSRSALRIIRRKWRLLAITAASLGLNPWGEDLLHSSLQYLDLSVLRQVTEWQPWPRESWLWWLVILTWLLAWRQTRHTGLSSWGLRFWLLALGYFTWQSRRMIPWLLVISLPLAGEWCWHHTKIRRWLKRPLIYWLGIGLLGISWGLKFDSTFWGAQTWQTYCQTEIACSPQAVEFLRQANLPGRMLNPYRWGGWLIWQYPEKKVWLDGRMTLWQDQEGRYILPQYRQVIDTAPGLADRLAEWQFGFAVLHPAYALSNWLVQNGWPVAYQDSQTVILLNPQQYAAYIN